MQHEKLLLQDSILNITPEKSIKKKRNILEPTITPDLTVTPESKLKSKKLHKIIAETKDIGPDPLLNITPEKPILLKKIQARKESKTHNRVRFNIPTDPVKNDENKLLQSVRSRSPLKDISENNTQLSETISSSGSGESTSWYSSEDTSISSFSSKKNDIKDMSGVVINGFNEQKIQPRIKIVNKKKQNNSQGQIIEVAQQQNDVTDKINRLTKVPNRILNTKPTKPMLKKKSGLHRHQHTIQYESNDEDDQTVLSKPNYNSSLAVGQELQALKLEEFNPTEILSQKLTENEELKMYIAEKTAQGTNIPFEDKLYSNLISVEADGSWKQQLSHTATFKKLKPAIKMSPKAYAKPNHWFKTNLNHCEAPSKSVLPDVMDNFSEANYHEEIMLDLKCIKLERTELHQAPIDDAMSLDVLSNLWNDML